MRDAPEEGKRIHREWDTRARSLDTDGLISLYAQGAILETPLVSAIFEGRSGILRGHRGFGRSSRRARAADRTSIRPFALVANFFKRFGELLVTGYLLARTFFRFLFIVGDQPVRAALNRVRHLFHDCRARLFTERITLYHYFQFVLAGVVLVINFWLFGHYFVPPLFASRPTYCIPSPGHPKHPLVTVSSV
jgi:hypothetical protein